MGNYQSQSVQQYVSSNAKFQTDVKTKFQTGNDSVIDTTTVQNLNLDIGGVDQCCTYISGYNNLPGQSPEPITSYAPGCTGFQSAGCGITIDQLANSSQETYNTSDTQFSSEIADELNAAMKAEMEAAVNSVQESDWTEFFPNVSKQDVELNIEQELDDIFTDETTFTNINNSINTAFNDQNQNLTVCGYYAATSGDCLDINQEASTDIYANNVLNTVGNVVAENSAIAEFFDEITAALGAGQKGFFGSIWSFLALGIGAVVFLVLAGLVIFALVRLIAGVPAQSQTQSQATTTIPAGVVRYSAVPSTTTQMRQVQ